MTLSLIAAVARNGVIGANKSLPWHLPADLRYFKEKTLGKPVLMGRATYESIGRPLPGRQMIVLTHDRSYQAPECTVVHSLDDALQAGGNAELMVIGGAALFAQTLGCAQRLYLTEITADVAGDTYFPAWNRDEWYEVERRACTPDAHNAYFYDFVVLERRT